MTLWQNIYILQWVFPCGANVKTRLSKWDGTHKDTGLIPGLGISLKGVYRQSQYSCLENPWVKVHSGLWSVQVRDWTQLKVTYALQHLCVKISRTWLAQTHIYFIQHTLFCKLKSSYLWKKSPSRKTLSNLFEYRILLLYFASSNITSGYSDISNDENL